MKSNTKKQAFTLAEVLIVIGIIGLIADMTIPTLLSSYRKQVTVTQLRKVFSEITEAIRMAEVEHGEMSSWDFTIGEGKGWQEQNLDFFKNYLGKHIKFVKICAPITSECWKEAVTASNIPSADLGSTYYNTFVAGVTASGYSVNAWTSQADHALIWVDLNGPNKGHSKMGEDIFGFRAVFKHGKVHLVGMHLEEFTKRSPEREELIDMSALGSTYGCKNTGSSGYEGGACGALIQYDGWKISDDYPIKF